MFLRAKSFRVFEGGSVADWNRWNADGRREYFQGKRRTNIGALEKGFVADRYLEAYPDIKAANKRGGEEWAFKHFLQAGLFEIFAGRREDRIGLRALGNPAVFVSRRVADGFLNLFGLPCPVGTENPGLQIVGGEGQLGAVQAFNLGIVASRSQMPEFPCWIYGAFVSPVQVFGILVSGSDKGRYFEDLIVSNGYAGIGGSAVEIFDASVANWIMTSKITTAYGATIPEILEDLFGEEAQRQKINAEHVKVTNNNSIHFIGWCLDNVEAFEKLTILANDNPVIFKPEQLLRYPRTDLLETAGNLLDNVYEAGLVGLSSYPGSPRSDLSCLVMLTSKTLVSWGIYPIQYMNVSPKAALKTLVSTLPVPSSKALARFFQGGAGKVLRGYLSKNEHQPVAYMLDSHGELPAEPEVSVIIPLYGRMDFIKFQIANFAEDSEFSKVDLIYVVDDPKNSELARQLADFSWDVFRMPFRVVYLSENQGYGGANNAGAQIARGQKLVFLNSDVIPKTRGWLGKLTESLNDPANGIVGARLLFHDETIQHDGMSYSRDRHLGLDGFVQCVHQGKGIAPQSNGEGVFPVDATTGACMAISKSDFMRVGGFSPDYFIGDYEDSDLCLKIRALGKKIVINRGCILYHLERQSLPFEPAARISSILNVQTHQEKWASVLQSEGLIK